MAAIEMPLVRESWQLLYQSFAQGQAQCVSSISIGWTPWLASGAVQQKLNSLALLLKVSMFLP